MITEHLQAKCFGVVYQDADGQPVIVKSAPMTYETALHVSMDLDEPSTVFHMRPTDNFALGLFDEVTL